MYFKTLKLDSDGAKSKLPDPGLEWCRRYLDDLFFGNLVNEFVV